MSEEIQAGDLVRIKADALVAGPNIRPLRDIGAIGYVLPNYNGNTTGVYFWAAFPDRERESGEVELRFTQQDLCIELVDIDAMTAVEDYFGDLLPEQATNPTDALAEARERVAALEQERDELRAALAPFANAAEDEDVKAADEKEALLVNNSEGDYSMAIMTDHIRFLEVRHLRAAAEALRKAKTK